MSINNGSPFSGLVSLVLVLVIIGAVAALALSGSDLTNFLTNSAKADAIREQNRIQAQKDAIELKNYEALQEIETNLQKEKILADTAAYQRNIEQQLLFQQQQNQQNLELQFQRSNQDLEVSRLTRYVLLGAGVLTMLFISMGLSIFFIQLGHSRVIAVQSVSTLYSRWQDPEWRKKQIAIARRREINARKSPTAHEDAKADETPTSIAIPITWQLVHAQNADQ